jgi:uncharacterized delta-60 repeat protein
MSQSLYFIDTNLSDYKSIVASLSPTDTYYLINSDSDGLMQIADLLSSYSNLDALHILSHGSVGSLNIGSTVLNIDNITYYQSLLQTIGSSLTDNGDVLLYGCNVAQGETGEAFVNTLSKYMNVDVAASTNVTGSSALGGDWILESTIGTIDAATIKTTAYGSVLAANTAPRIYTGNDINDTGKSIALQADGKILVAGYSGNGSQYDFALVRYNSDGSLDTTFSNNGMVKTDVGTSYDYGSSVTVQVDGKIIVTGSSAHGSLSDFALVRYNSNGSLDTTFSNDGIVTTSVDGGYDSATSVTVQADGKILVGGTGNGFFLVRYNSDGSLDTTFSSDGIVKAAISGFNNDHSVTVQADGKILIAGYSIGSNYDFALARYNSDGSLDTTFGSNGVVTTAIGTSNESGESVTVQADGKILVAGFSYISGTNYDFALVRYNSDGSLDTTFSGDGIVTTPIAAIDDYGYSVYVQSDGKILLAGYSDNGTNYDFALVRYNSDGSLDTTFGGDGIVTTAVGTGQDGGYSATVQTDGKILVAGFSIGDFAVVRYNSDGSLDTSFDSDGKITTAIHDTTFIENGEPVVLMHVSGNIRDTELSAIDNYNGSTLTLARNGTADSQDQFSGSGIVAGQASGNVTTSGTIVGTYTYSHGSLLKPQLNI